MGLWDKITRIFAARSPTGDAVPNQSFIWYDNVRGRQKQVLSKPPSVKQLRAFARNSIVRRPINLASDTISRLEYRLVNIDPDSKRKYARQKQIAQTIIDNPNIVHSRRVFTKMVVEDLVVLDAGVFEKTWGKDVNRPLFLYPVDGATMQMVVPYDYTNDNAARYAQQQPKEIRYFSAKQIAYLQRNQFTDTPYGLYPVLATYQYIQQFLNANERADGVAGNATADFLISLGERVKPNEREEFIRYFAEEIEGTGKIPVFSGTDSVDTKQIRAISKDGLYQEWQQFLLTIVAISFGLPPQKIGVLMQADRSTADDLDKIVMDELVKPYADIIEDAYNEHVLRPLGFDKYFRFEFVYEESQKDKTQKTNRINSEFQAGYITPNEAREKAGYSRIENEYCDMIADERKARINADIGSNGYHGVGNDGWEDKVTENKLKEVK